MSQKIGLGAAYRKNKANRAEQTFEVTLPSGAVFVLRPAPLEQFILSGTMPLGIAEKMEAAQMKGKSTEEAFKTLSVGEQAKSIEFATKLVRYICVNPKIVDIPQSDDEIAPEEILVEDFEFLILWAKGGGEAEKLDSFRSERLDDVVDQSGGEE